MATIKARQIGYCSVRLPKGTSTQVKCLAHEGLVSGDPRGTADRFSAIGLIFSDEVFAGSDQGLLGAFMRTDTDDEYGDYHHLRGRVRYLDPWGVGRHLLRSQMFDYRADPFGYAPERWADPDKLTAATPTNVWPVCEGFVEQNSDAPTDLFHGRGSASNVGRPRRLTDRAPIQN